MKLRRLLLGPIGLAAAAALMLATGTLAGGLAYEATHPEYDRLTWFERDPTDPDGDRAVRRVLFSDGRFLALTDDGYRAGVLDSAVTDEIFATAAAEAGSWQDAYPAALTGELAEVELVGGQTRTISVANPALNLELPATLSRVLTLLAAADRTVASVPVAPAALRFEARLVSDTSGAPLDALPQGLALAEAADPAGTVVGGSDLALVMAEWTDLGVRLAPGVAHRFVEADGAVWRISWTLDLESIGALDVGAVR